MAGVVWYGEPAFKAHEVEYVRSSRAAGVFVMPAETDANAEVGRAVPSALMSRFEQGRVPAGGDALASPASVRLD
jgi:hypothetical protein